MSELWLDDLQFVSDSDLFTEIAKTIISRGEINSALSDRPAEIIHHIERRQTRPDLILEAENLVPLTAEEHSCLHNGQIEITSTNNVIFCTDRRWGRIARFRLCLSQFYKEWNKEKGAVLNG